nr:zf-HC2 domain-containing protein [Actinomycetota bacterium]
MKARILALDSDEHRDVQTLLPWFVNKTLDDLEAARVEAHVAGCVRCQGDAAWQGRLRDTCGLGARADDAASNVDRGWSALRPRLDAKPPAPAPRTPRAAGRAPQPWLRWPRSLVASHVGVVLLTALVLFGATRPNEPYRGLGSPAPTVTEANVVVVFKPGATETQIRAALRASDARLVGGPTVTDAYLLHLSDPGPGELARLRL